MNNSKQERAHQHVFRVRSFKLSRLCCLSHHSTAMHATQRTQRQREAQQDRTTADTLEPCEGRQTHFDDWMMCGWCKEQSNTELHSHSLALAHLHRLTHHTHASSKNRHGSQSYRRLTTQALVWSFSQGLLFDAQTPTVTLVRCVDPAYVSCWTSTGLRKMRQKYLACTGRLLLHLTLHPAPD